MWVSSITKGSSLDSTSQLLFRQVRRSVLLPEIPADGIIVFGSHFESFQGKLGTSGLANIAISILPRVKELLVVSWVGKDRNTLMVFSRCTQEGDTADVNLFNSVCKRAARLGDSLGEGVQVADNDRDGGNGLCLQVLLIRWDRSSKNTCGTYLRMRWVSLTFHSMFEITYLREQQGGEF